MRENSLVLYKQKAARVLAVKDKLEIETIEGRQHRVRPKDVALIHPGPCSSFAELVPQQGEVEEAWELLQGESTTLEALSELVFGGYAPATAWATWQLVDEDLFFTGEPDAIEVRDDHSVAEIRQRREAREQRAQAWEAFVERLGRGTCDRDRDREYLADIEQLALGRRDQSRVLRELGRAEQPEVAHAVLCAVGYWDGSYNPYPQRQGVALTPPALELGALPSEARRDLCHLPAYAIDDEDSHDPDDAISMEGQRLWVHVADVAALVPPDSPADLEARRRGANLYLPETIVPMLPEQATAVLGLGLSERSPALSFALEFAEDATPQLVEVVPSWIQVQRLSYRSAEPLLDEGPLQECWHRAQANLQRRQRLGAVMFDLPEVRLRLEQGAVAIKPLPPLRSRTLVTEAMLMTGEAVAAYAQREGIALPFASQPLPGCEGPLETMAQMFACRMRMKRSQVKVTPEPHGGLGLDAYSQATSPLRRYADLLVHQQLRAHLLGQPLLDQAALVERIGAYAAVIGSVRRSERLSNQHWTCVYLKQQSHWRGEAVVVELQERKAKLIIPELAWEFYASRRGEWTLDQVVTVRCQGVNLPERTPQFQIEG